MKAIFSLIAIAFLVYTSWSTYSARLAEHSSVTICAGLEDE